MPRRIVGGLPVPLWGAIASCSFMLLGWNWDIQWHRSIGRDTVWTIAHIAIYVALSVAFFYTSWLVWSYTFGRDKEATAIRVLGFRGPSGAFVTLWSILLQFACILFDNWWHNVFGLDSQVFTPPHAFLALGVSLFYVGQFVLVAQYRNVAPPEEERRTRWVMVMLGSLMVGHMTIALDPSYGPQALKSHDFVITIATTMPLSLLVTAVYLESRWAGAICAAIYMAAQIVMMQIFQFFPSTPRFGPVYHDLPNFLPPAFPLVLIVPALAVTPLLPRLFGRPRWGTFLLIGAVFALTFNATNFFMADFLRSGWADNRFFGGGYPAAAFLPDFRETYPMHADLLGAITIGLSVLVTSGAVWVAYVAGRWLRRLIR